MSIKEILVVEPLLIFNKFPCKTTIKVTVFHWLPTLETNHGRKRDSEPEEEESSLTEIHSAAPHIVLHWSYKSGDGSVASININIELNVLNRAHSSQ
jgi:hypothetical protein